MRLIKLPTDAELLQMIKDATELGELTRAVMAAEILEYRMSYGPLGCESLDIQSEAFTKRVGY